MKRSTLIVLLILACLTTAAVSTQAAPGVTIEQMGMVAPGLRGYVLVADSDSAAEVNSFQFDITGNPHQVWENLAGPETILLDDQGPGYLPEWERWDTRLLNSSSQIISIPGFPITSETNDNSNPAGLTLTGVAGVGTLSVDGLSYTPTAAGPVMSFAQVIVPVGNTVEVDGLFITEISPGVAGPVVIDQTLAGVALLAGDANGDGTVNPTDLAALTLNWLGTDKVWTEGDFNFDGNVNPTDLADLTLNWLQSLPSSPAPVFAPEPGSIALLALGGAAILRRRRA